MADGESDPNLRVPRFDTVLRGYNPRQVNERVTRLSFDLSHVTKSRDEAVAKVAELTKALGSAQQQLLDSKDQLHRITVNPTSTEAMSERQLLMWQLAEEEIAEFKRDADNYDRSTRADADEYSHSTRAKADSHASATREEADAYSAKTRSEADEHAAGVRKAADQYTAQTKAAADEYAASVKADVAKYAKEQKAKQDGITAELAERRKTLEAEYAKNHATLENE